MPHMNRARLVNVAFNDAKSFFDDLRLNFSGKSATYDLENGGGKSVLLMMLLQVVIPNISLREDKPLKNIFLGGRDRTSHVLIEWTLDEGERYQYMLTGFCARKKRSRIDEQRTDGIFPGEDEDVISEGIDYYNYVIFYNEPTYYDIYSLELAKEDSGGKVYKGYDELRGELKRLAQRNIPINIFDRKGEYMDFIGGHNLISTEWKIIREINSGENSIEKYFRENKTSRRLIENLLLPIIDDTEKDGTRSGKLGDGKNEQLADTLIEIRENLARLLKDREHLGEFGQIRSFYNRILDLSKRMEGDFLYQESLQQDAVKIKNLLEDDLEKVSQEIASVKAGIEEKEENNKKTQQEKKLLDIQLLEFDKNALMEKQKDVKGKHDTLVSEMTTREGALKEACAKVEYMEYKAERVKKQVEEKRLEIISIEKDDALKEYQRAGDIYKTALEDTDKNLRDRLDSLVSDIERLEKDNKQIDVETTQINIALGSYKTKSQIKEEEIKKNEARLKELTDYFNGHGRMDILVHQIAFLESAASKIVTLKETLDATANQLEINSRDLEKTKAEILDNNNKINELIWHTKEPKEYLKAYEEALKSIQNKMKLYDVGSMEELKDKLTKILMHHRTLLIQKRIEENTWKNRIQILDMNGFFVPNEEILSLSDKLKSKCVFVQPGIKWLNSLDNEDRKARLEQISLLPYSVLVDHESFVKIKDGRLNVGEFFNDYPVPIIDIDMIISQEIFELKEVLFPRVNENLILSEDALKEYKDRLGDDLLKVQASALNIEEAIETYGNDLKDLKEFATQFSPQNLEEAEAGLKALEEKLKACKDTIRESETLQKELKKRGESLIKTREDILKETELIVEWKEKAENLLNLNGAQRRAKQEFQELRQELTALENRLSKLIQTKESNKNALKALEGEERGIDKKRWSVGEQLSRVADFDVISPPYGPNIPIDNLDRARAGYEALEDKVKDRIQEGDSIKNNIKAFETVMKKCAANMLTHHGISVEAMEKRELAGEIITKPDAGYIDNLKSNVKKLKAEIDLKKKEYDDLNNKIKVLEGQIIGENRQLDKDMEIRTGRFEFRHEIEKAIEDATQIITLYLEELSSLNSRLEELNKRSDHLHRESDGYQDFITRENILYKTEELGVEAKGYQEFNSLYYGHSNRMKDWNQSWGREIKVIQRETEGFFIQEPIKELERLEIPKNLGECRMLMGQLDNSLDIIDEKMDKIQEDISLLNSYQEEFVLRCIKRADSALDTLKKFPALSRIDIEGKRENMVKMEFRDFDENEKTARMENHINSIIQEIGENESIDRIRIANRLSTRELLAQVTNMERAVVRLYKVENIKEHSRYLRWENAVGSEGQSNALYFIFAVCLISYIRLLSANTTSARTKKIIIADNPFGATSAVYLWEPMFNILKANDVQLIAPGHNIPRELTSQFEVNYLLNQDILSDSRIRVVIKDVRTEEDLDQMNFGALEQVSLFT